MAENFRIIRQHRASISLQVTRSGEVVVKAPHLVPQFIINQFISSKKDWIEKALTKLAVFQTKKKIYKEGEEFLYLGNVYKLQFHVGTAIAAKDTALFFPKALQFRIKKELENWFQKQAQAVITKRAMYHAEKMKVKYKDIFFSDTSSKWGTCFADNTLQFNWRLIMAPLLVIDYVVIHELTHITQKHHQDSFWRRVRLFTPAYKQHRKWLDTNGHLLQF